MRQPLTNALSVDVEDWHSANVLEFGDVVVPPTDAVRENTARMLSLFDELGAKATWFFLGEVAEAFPNLVREIVAAGHELGIHGWHHHQIPRLSPDDYARSIRRAKDVVEQIGGVEVLGYRATDFSINRRTWYAFDLLIEAGFRYDSSLFPFRGPRYGMGDIPLGPHWIHTGAGSIYEIPVTVGRTLGVRHPAAGGGYLRHFPLAYTKLVLRSAHRAGRPGVFYCHPYELDHTTPFVEPPDEMSAEEAARLRRTFRSHGRNRHKTEAKLRRLLRDHHFDTMKAVFAIDEAKPGDQALP